VGGFERAGDLQRQAQGLFQRQMPAVQPLGERVALHQLQHQETRPAGLFEAVDAGDVRMVERRQRAGLALESGEPVGIRCELGRQRLDGHVASQPGVAGAVDFAHSALAEQVLHFVWAERVPGGESHRLGVAYARGRSEKLAPSLACETRRPLTESEHRAIRAKLHASESRRRRASKRAPVAGAVIIGVLWVLTMIASDAPWHVVTGFWLAVGAGITLWVRRDLRKDATSQQQWTQGLDSALRRNEADVYDIRAGAFVELEEFEDEGACYAFALDEARVVFISGQEFYEAARFPSLDFSLVYVLDEAGRVADMLIEKRGPKAAPARTIPFAVKHELEVPEHLEVRHIRLDELEDRLRVRVQSPR